MRLLEKMLCVFAKSSSRPFLREIRPRRGGTHASRSAGPATRAGRLVGPTSPWGRGPLPGAGPAGQLRPGAARSVGPERPHPVDLAWGTGNYTYGVALRQDGSCLGGPLPTSASPWADARADLRQVNRSQDTFPPDTFSEVQHPDVRRRHRKAGRREAPGARAFRSGTSHPVPVRTSPTGRSNLVVQWKPGVCPVHASRRARPSGSTAWRASTPRRGLRPSRRRRAAAIMAA